MALESWNTVTVHGTWRRHDGSLRPGTYKASIPVRVTNTPGDSIIPAGTFATGPLNTTGDGPSLLIQAPATDDPDNSPSGWQITIEVTFPDAIGEKYVLDIPLASGAINLRNVILSTTLPPSQVVVLRGVPGGLAELDADGDVIDSDGNKVVGGGGGGVSSFNDLTDVPTTFPPTIGSTSTTAVAGNDARLTDQRTPTDSSVTNAKVAAGAAVSLDKTADSATRLAMTSTERTKLTGVATGATANSTDATLLARANHTGSQAQSTITNLTADLAAKAPLASPIFTGTVVVPTATGATSPVRKEQLDAVVATIPTAPSAPVRFKRGADLASDTAGTLLVDPIMRATVAVGTYDFDVLAHFYVTGDASHTTDVAVGFALPDGSTIDGTVQGIIASAASAQGTPPLRSIYGENVTDYTAVVHGAINNNIVPVWLVGTVEITTAGVFALTWGQGNVTAFPVTIKALSRFYLKRVD